MLYAVCYMLYAFQFTRSLPTLCSLLYELDEWLRLHAQRGASAPHRIASHRIASHRIASHRIAYGGMYVRMSVGLCSPREPHTNCSNGFVCDLRSHSGQ
jgi:hypothetical protein